MGAIVAFGALLRLALGEWVTAELEKRAGADPAWVVGWDDVDLTVHRGAVALDGLALAPADRAAPRLAVERAELALDADALLDGHFVATLELVGPVLELRPPGETEGDTDWPAALARLCPFPIDAVRVTRGEVRLREAGGRPDADLVVRDVWVEATGITRSAARADASGRAGGEGTLVAHLVADPRARVPTFELELQLRGLDLERLAPAVERWAGARMDAGKLDLFVEAAGRDGAWHGYAKPVYSEVRGHLPKPGPARWTALLAGPVPERQATGRVVVEGRFAGSDSPPWKQVADALGDAAVVGVFDGIEASMRRTDGTQVVDPARLGGGRLRDGSGRGGLRDRVPAGSRGLLRDLRR